MPRPVQFGRERLEQPGHPLVQLRQNRVGGTGGGIALFGGAAAVIVLLR